MTNFEKIKSMSIEEMAKADFTNCDWCEYAYNEKCASGQCVQGKLEWLNQDVDELTDKHTLTPEQFKAMMLDTANNEDIDEEDKHRQMDEIMCGLLSQLGYDDGIRIFNSTPKWYA